MKKGFSLVELLIVLSMLGIIAAIVVPTFQSYTQQTKEATAKDHLRTLRTIIEIYSAKNSNIPPGYPDNDTLNAPTEVAFNQHITTASGEPGQLASNILECPKNPFNNKKAVKIIADAEAFPSDPVQTDTFGWVYKPATKNIRLNYDGTDSEGVAYFSY